MKTQATTRGGRAFTLTELLVVIFAVAVVVAVLLPALVPDHHSGRQAISCASNLKQITIAFRIWAGDNGGKYPMQVSVTNGGAMELAVTGDVAGIFRVMSNELATPIIVICPQDAKRIAATNFAVGFSDANISYFVGLDAEDQYPQMLLSGDDNLEVNGNRVRPGVLNLSTNTSVGWTTERIGKFHGPGNIGLVEGSVWSNVPTLKSALVNAGIATNRLVIP